MKREKELLFNTAIIGIGNFSTKLIAFFLLPLYTSLLSTTDYGLCDLLITIATFLTPFITLLMEESMFRFLIDCKTNQEKEKIISQTILYTLVSCLIFTFLYIIINLFIKIKFSFLLYLYIISNVLVGLRNAITRGLGKIKLFALINFISSLIIILLNIILIYFLHKGVGSLLISFIIANLLTSLYIFLYFKIYNYISLKSYDKNKMKEMLKYSYPLVPNSISWTVVNLSDRIVISSVLGAASNGIYSISYKFPSIMDTFYGFFYSAWKESAAKTIKDSDSEKFYISVFSTLKSIMWSIVLMMIIILPFCFNILVKNEFRTSYLYIPILLIAMYFSNMAGFFGGVFSAYKDTKVMGITTIIGAIVNFVVDLSLIYFIGIWAAAISTLASTVIIYYYRFIKTKKYLKLKVDYKSLLLNILSLSIALVSYYSKNVIIHFVCFLIIFIYCIFCNKSTINVFSNIIMKKILKKNNQ